MHFHVEVHIPSLPGDLHAEIERIMEPFREDWDEESSKSTGWWDWWQIGGRWTGEHLSRELYDAAKDPRNADPVRPGAVKWSTQWAPAACDVMHVSDIREDLTAYTVVAGGRDLHVKVWNGDDFVPHEIGEDETVLSVLKRLGIDSGYLVTVDCHN